MTTQKVTVVLDIADIGGNLFSRGSVRIFPSVRLPDPADQVLLEQAPARASFGRTGPPGVDLYPNDLIGPQNGNGTPGWTYTVYYDGCPGNPAPWSFYLLSANGGTQRLSELAAVPAAQPGAQYVPLPNAPPSSASQVLGLASDSPMVTEWVDQSGGGGGSGTVTSVSVATANGFAGTVASPATTPAVTLKTTANGLLKGNSTTGAVSAAAAGTDYLAPNGSGAALTGITASQAGADASGAASAALASAEAYTDTETARAEAAEALKLARASNLSDLASASTARTNLGLGSAATHASTDFDAAGAAAAVSGAVAAELGAAGGIATLDGSGRVPAAQLALALLAASNLSDLASAATARGNLGLGSAALLAASAVLQAASNLSDLASAPAARTNLGLGSAAVLAASAVAQTANNLSDLASASTARTNLGLGAAALIGTPVIIGNGGTGQATQQAAINALTGTQSSGKVLRSDGTNAALDTIKSGDLPAATTGAQGAVKLDGTAGDIQPVGTAGAAGSAGQAADAGHVHKGFAKLATTGTAGFTLTNGTPNIISWTAPSDGAVHMFVCVSVAHVTSAETGGTVQVIYQSPITGVTNHFTQILAGGLGTDTNGQTGTTIFALVQPGATVTVQQTVALTAGAATVYAELWGN